MSLRLFFALCVAVSLGCGGLLGTPLEQAEDRYRWNNMDLDTIEGALPTRKAEIDKAQQDYAVEYAALPPEEAAREPALSALNERVKKYKVEMQAQVDAAAAAAKSAADAKDAEGQRAADALRGQLTGTWTGGGLTFVIDAGGGVHYENHSGGVDKTIDAPIQRFDSKGLEIGLFGITTTFRVDALPHDDNGVWKMTLDGVELTRQ